MSGLFGDDMPEIHCLCGHHEGSHCRGFAATTCLWCDCRTFTAAPESARV